MFGYHKKLLRVDLGNRKVEVEDLHEKVILKYIAGLGIEAKIIHEETGRPPYHFCRGPNHFDLRKVGVYDSFAVSRLNHKNTPLRFPR